MHGESILWLWTALGFTWWIVALLLVVSSQRGRQTPTTIDRRRITVFKPLARLANGDFERLRPCLESFVAALDDNSELIIGCHEWDQSKLQPFVEKMRGDYPRADIRLVVHRNPNHHANPKVAWMQILVPHATGELWLWSDADMEAPANALQGLRTDLSVTKASFLTSPYVVKNVNKPAELLDAVFVNLEFFPGVLLLGRLDLIRFGFGSGMLFEAEAFHQRVDWDYLGSCLAEDFHLGRMLAPARLGTTRFATSPAAQNWKGAFLHYLRWQKTIRWCRPGSFAAQLTILPVLGWLVWGLLNPLTPAAWLGLLAVILVDCAAAALVCRALRCRIRRRALLALPLWSLFRGLAWSACWLPWPIVWCGKKWWSPRRRVPPAEILEPESQVGLD
jgi:ceramide glucosyltransferase